MADRKNAPKQAQTAKGKRLGKHAKVEALTLKVTADTLEEIDALIAFHEQRFTRLGASNTVSAIARDALERGLSLLCIEAAYPELRSELESFNQRLSSAHVEARRRADQVRNDPQRRLPALDHEGVEAIIEVLGRYDD